jgi:hypothetical protein
VAVATGFSHSLALKANGRVVGWGDNWAGQANVPADLSNVVAIAVGSWHNVALTASGAVVAWGSDLLGISDIPALPANVAAIAEDPNACGYYGNPIGFGKHCFFAGLGGDPWWPAIFHELDHNSASLVVRIMYGELTYGAGLYVEGDANLPPRWSGESLVDNLVLAEATERASSASLTRTVGSPTSGCGSGRHRLRHSTTGTGIGSGRGST